MYPPGNTWGDCGNGTQAVGCGPQENFVNCADVQIVSNAFGLPPNAVNSLNGVNFRDGSTPGAKKKAVK